MSGEQALPSGTVGAMSELVASVDLLSRGYEVFRAVSSACSCDLIALGDDRKPLRIEVRTGRRSLTSGMLHFPRNGRQSTKRTEDDLDHYCVVVGNKEIIYIPALPGETITAPGVESPWAPGPTGHRCGTQVAYKAHLRRNEDPEDCEKCAAGRKARMARRKERRVS